MTVAVISGTYLTVSTGSHDNYLHVKLAQLETNRLMDSVFKMYFITISSVRSVSFGDAICKMT